MARHGKSSADKEAAAPKGQRRRPALPWRRPVLKASLVLAGVLAVLGGLVYGFWRLGRLVRSHPDYLVSRSDLAVVSLPKWMPPAAQADLDIAALAPELPKTFSLLDPSVCASIAAAYERSVWIERVERIEKNDPRADPDRRLLIHLKFRRPVAFVASRGNFYLVDQQGVRLPGVYQEPVLKGCGPTPEDLPLLVVTGVATDPPVAGRIWDEASLKAGLKIAAELLARREKLRLKSVDVSNFASRRDPHRSEILLFTVNDTEIRWGKAPTPQAAMLQERSVAAKADYLEYVYERVGNVDGVLEYVDIPNEVIRRRASTTAYQLRS